MVKKYVALRPFIDKSTGHQYKKDDEYPAKDSKNKLNDKQLKQLIKPDNDRQPFVGEFKEGEPNGRNDQGA
ncbi:hypothetical protein [Enterococcus sp.]|uniref:hypothetical protein n=1 Tax=Enterococcus sp. TaxID=35783 RepID=UPI002897720F|nr:hypothetical protein [Enterococcus sp.]